MTEYEPYDAPDFIWIDNETGISWIGNTPPHGDCTKYIRALRIAEVAKEVCDFIGAPFTNTLEWQQNRYCLLAKLKTAMEETR